MFLTNLSPEHKYDSIGKYGAMRPVTSGNYPVFKTQRLLEEIVTQLSDSEDEDYLAIGGSAAIASLCLLVWLMLHKECNLLLYDPRQEGYVPRSIKKSEIVIQIEKRRDAIERLS